MRKGAVSEADSRGAGGLGAGRDYSPAFVENGQSSRARRDRKARFAARGLLRWLVMPNARRGRELERT